MSRDRDAPVAPPEHAAPAPSAMPWHTPAPDLIPPVGGPAGWPDVVRSGPDVVQSGPDLVRSGPELVRSGPGLGSAAVAPAPRTTLSARWAAVPLRARLVAILLAALFAALAATGYGVQAVLSGFLQRQIDDQLVAAYSRSVSDGDFLGNIIGSSSRGSSGPGDRGTGPTNFAFFVQTDGSSSGTVVNGQPKVTAPRFSTLTNARATTLNGAVFTVPAASGGHAWRAVAVPAQIGGVSGSVVIALPLQDVDLAVDRLRLLTLLIGALVAVACTILGWLAIRRSFRPLLEVEETAAAIAAGDLSRRVPERPVSTEVGRLTRSLNGMLTQIESAFRSREASEARTRRFAADASHELRTPLASIRGFAELYRQGAVPAEDVPRTMRRIEDEAKRMGGLVEDLLLLARLDEQRSARAEPVDLAVLAGDAVHDVRGLDPDRTVRLVGLSGAGGPAPAVVTGDEDRLRQVVANLVANAVRHTPPATPVEVAVGRDGERAVLEVRDHGRGLTPEQVERVFERFYRVDASRQRGSGGGSGLGLSIVSAVVASHGGTVDVGTTPGGGATFRVALPATG